MFLHPTPPCKQEHPPFPQQLSALPAPAQQGRRSPFSATRTHLSQLQHSPSSSHGSVMPPRNLQLAQAAHQTVEKQIFTTGEGMQQEV